MAEFEIPPEGRLEAITRRTAERMKHQLLAVSARYDRRGGRVMIALNNGAVVGFPLASLPGMENATPDELRHIVVEGEGVACLDADISVPQLLADQLGSTVMKRAVVRASASRANGRLGGRPRKSQAA